MIGDVRLTKMLYVALDGSRRGSRPFSNHYFYISRSVTFFALLPQSAVYLREL